MVRPIMTSARLEDRCLDPDDLAAYMNARLAPPGVHALEAHVATCAACRELLSALARSQSAIALAPTLAPQDPPDPSSGRLPLRGEDVELARGALIGRYVVQARLGAGGMGVVYSAHDPELDRHVALKLLRADAFTPSLQEPLRERLRQEAQSMARLAHPNVVAVYDVGSFGGRIFIAMELIEGVTLSAWLAEKPRRWQEIVAMFVQAGHGVAAAHAAGLVHRDFKPENVLIGADGRVRVGDFGLARASAGGEDTSTANVLASALAQRRTLTGSLVGTPFYMAPEQYLGQPVDPRTDQFSFCVALSTAITGVHPFDGDSPEGLAFAVTHGRLRPPPRPDRMPGWLRRVLERGLALEPGDRYPSMEPLLTALGRNPTRRLVLGGVALAAALVVAGGVAVAYRQGTTSPALRCKGAERKWAGIWDPARAQAIQAAFAATGKPFAAGAFARVKDTFDGYSRAWSTMHTEACEATRVRGEQPEDLLEKRMVCLDARLRDARALLDRLAGADPDVVAHVPRALTMLGDLSSCADVQALTSQVPLPASPTVRAEVAELRGRLAEVRATRTAVGGGKGLDTATAVVSAAQKTGYRPLEAEALYELGQIEEDAADYTAAEHALDQAVWAAAAGRHDELEARAWTGLMEVKGRLGHEAEGLTLRPRVTALLERLGGGDDELTGVFHATAARLLGRTDHFEDASAEAQKALTLLEKRFGPDDVRVADALDVMAGVAIDSGRYADAIGFRQRALAIKQKVYGQDNPELGKAMGALAEAFSKASRYPESEAMYKQALAFSERVDPPNHPDIAAALYGFGLLYQRTGQYDEAIEMHRRSVEIARVAFGKDHPRYATYLQAYGWAMATVGHYEEALPPLAEALATTERLRGPEHTSVASCLVDIAEMEHYLHREADARAHLERALAILEKAHGASSPKLITALLLLGIVELNTERYDRALVVLERALAIQNADPTTDPVYAAGLKYEVAEALIGSKGDRVRAVKLAREARAAMATDPTQKVNLGKVDRFLRRWDR
jgi:tetratricopeptide (TPR) repeat protein/tRNA A-37 threonylcarbamoyl transferase component Bud32